MKQKLFEIRESGNEDKLLATVMAFDGEEALEESGLIGYYITCVSNRVGKPSIVDVARDD